MSTTSQISSLATRIGQEVKALWAAVNAKAPTNNPTLTGKVTLGSVGGSAGLEFGSSGPRMMMDTGGPSGISAPVGSTWRQTDANASHGSLTGLLWNKVGSGTTEGVDWLVDFEGRWIAYTPTLSGGWAVGTGGTTTGWYTRSGKTVTVLAKSTLGTSFTVGSNWRVTLPVNSSRSAYDIGVTALLMDFGSNTYTAVGTLATTGLNVAPLGAGGAPGWFTTTNPFTWAASDAISATATYEIA